MKRQDSLPSSSCHRENASDKLHAKAVGCMSGLFHFVSGSHSRRKFLTFGKRQEKSEVSSRTMGKKKSSSTKANENNNSPPLMVNGENKAKDQKNTTISVLERRSCEVPRSPTLPAEIRLSNSVNLPQNFRTPPALMARLMGLEEGPLATQKALPLHSPFELPLGYSLAEKRRRLIGALEKCDRDLKALKKIIDAVRSAEGLRSLPTAVFGGPKSTAGGDHHARVGKTFLNNNSNAVQPSSVSVLDEFMTRSALSSHQHSKQLSYNYGRVQHHIRQQKKITPGEEDFIVSPSIFDRLTCELLQRKPSLSADPPHGKSVGFESNSEDFMAALSPSVPPWISSRAAIKETVEEVCKDIAWGEKREIGKIGLALQDHICRDLIEETIADLGSFQSDNNNVNCSLPFQACKRRLCFSV